MNHPLQNNPGSKHFPVQGFSWSAFKKLKFAQLFTSLILVSMGLLFLVTLLGPIMLLAGMLVAYKGTSHLKREQKEYYKIGGMQVLNDEQLQALQLANFNEFECGHWIDTLETWPCEQRVPGHLKRFKFLNVLSTKALVSQLEESWGIISKSDYEDTYSNLIGGLHTEKFVRGFYSTEEKKPIVQRLCGLTQISEAQFYGLLRSDSTPRKLTWAWDLWRAIGITRQSYECGFIDEDLAWKNILLVSDYSHTLYESLEEFFFGIRIGHAYWCNDFKKVLERKETLENFMSPRYKHRIHKVGWTQKNVELPKNMQTGFKELEQKLSMSLNLAGSSPVLTDENFTH